MFSPWILKGRATRAPTYSQTNVIVSNNLRAVFEKMKAETRPV